MDTPIDQSILQTILNGIVADPSLVEIRRSEDDRGIFLSVRVAEDDAGKVIGKEGVTARAIRDVMHAVGKSQGLKVSMKIEN